MRTHFASTHSGPSTSNLCVCVCTPSRKGRALCKRRRSPAGRRPQEAAVSGPASPSPGAGKAKACGTLSCAYVSTFYTRRAAIGACSRANQMGMASEIFGEMQGRFPLTPMLITDIVSGHIYIYICIHTYKSTCMLTCMYLCAYIYIYIYYICMYIHRYMLRESESECRCLFICLSIRTVT